MQKQIRIPSALKHGYYQQLGILPSEDRAAFEKFSKMLQDELRISGPSESVIASTLAYRMWRMQNMQTYSLAEVVRSRIEAIYSQLNPPFVPLFSNPYKDTRTPEELAALRKEADKKVNLELGQIQELVDAKDCVTMERLDRELEILERLDSAISRSLKQLLMVRGIKSLLPTVASSSNNEKKS